MAHRRHGYKHTEVSGTNFVIKERYEGTERSSVARRLATDDAIWKVMVEVDGTIMMHIRSDETWELQEYVPDGWVVVGGMIHDTGNADAHIDIAPRDD